MQCSLEQLMDARGSNSSSMDVELEDFGLPIDNEQSMDDLENDLKDKHRRVLLVCIYPSYFNIAAINIDRLLF
jgi:hypothetical protein